jgi:hypothetical protein
MPPIKRTQIRNYDFHDADQTKINPDLIEADIEHVTPENLQENLDNIRSKIKKITGEASFQDDPIISLRDLAARSFITATSDTWGIIARLQGMIIAPEGPVTDDGNGNITVPNVLVSNPLTGTFVRILGFSANLGENGYVYFDLPPTSNINETIDATVVSDNPYDPLPVSPYDAYPSEDRVVLCQRIGNGRVWFKFSWTPASFS